MSRVLLVTSHPLSPPWDSADKQLARSVARGLPEHRFVALGRAGRRVDDVRTVPILTRRGRPGLLERIQTVVLWHGLEPMADLVHLVMTLGPDAPKVAALRRSMPRSLRRPVVHTIPGVVDPAVLPRVPPLGITVALSEGTATLLRDHGYRDVTVIPPAIPLERWPFTPPPTDPRPTVLFAGHHDDGGGAEDAIRSVARLRDDAGREVRLDLAMRSRPGQDQGRADARLLEMARNLGLRDVRVLGHVEDMRPVIRAASVVLLPMRTLRGKADVPLVVLEAMATGRPVVTSDLPGLRGLGDAVTLVAGGPEAVAAAVDRLLEHDGARAATVRRARALVEERFSERVMADAYRCVYAEALRRGPSVPEDDAAAQDRARRVMVDATWRGVRHDRPDDAVLRRAVELARDNQVQGALARTYPDRLEDEVARVAHSSRAFRTNLAEAAGLLASSGATPVLIKTDPEQDHVYSNFDLVVGAGGWAASVRALRGWGIATTQHPLERDKLLVHATSGPSAHLHHRVAWFGIPIVRTSAMRPRSSPSPAGPWLLPDAADALRITVAHAAFQNLAFDLSELLSLRRALGEPAILRLAEERAAEEGWRNGFRATVRTARSAIEELDGGGDPRMPVRLPVRVSLAVALEHAGHLLRTRRPVLAAREICLRPLLVLAKLRRRPR